MSNMKSTRLAILDLYDNTPNQGMRCIKDIVSRFEALADWEVFDVRGKAEVPDLSFDVYISTGGPGSPFAGDGTLWEKRYNDWLDQIWNWNGEADNPKKHVFFICHSFQMACHHYGVAKVNARKSQSFGTFPVHKTDAGAREPLFQGLPDPFYVADFRDWQVVQPNLERLEEMGAEILALEKIRPHVPLERAIMAIRFSDEIVGVQFHPEADPEGMVKHFLDPERRRKIIESHGKDKYLQMIDDLSDPNKISLTYEIILPGFLDRALRAVQQEIAFV